MNFIQVASDSLVRPIETTILILLLVPPRDGRNNRVYHVTVNSSTVRYSLGVLCVVLSRQLIVRGLGGVFWGLGQ